MILIVGNTHDDIVYFDSIIRNKKNEVILKKFNATIGTIFNQEVMLLKDVYTSILSATIVTQIIEKYFILLVFNVGKCQALPNTGFKIGDVAVSRRITFGDVNVQNSGETQVGQIPGFPRIFEVQQDVLLTLINNLSTKTYSKYQECNFVSCDVQFDNEQELQFIKHDEYVLGFDRNIVFDNNTAGLAVAGYIHDIPVVAIKVVSNIIGKKSTTEDYLTVLKNYASVGRAVVSSIGDISRNDVIRE